MDWLLYCYFILTSALFIIVPGPNVMVIVGTSLTHGVRRGLFTIAGTSLAMIIQLFIASAASAGLINLLAEAFIIVKWLGVMYLLYLGVRHCLAAFANTTLSPVLSASGSFSRGFFVSLTNPKTIVFFSAFLPQFISYELAIPLQLFVLSLTFVLLAVIFDSGYALLANKLKTFFTGRYLHRLTQSISGVTYLVAGSILATIKKSA